LQLVAFDLNQKTIMKKHILSFVLLTIVLIITSAVKNHQHNRLTTNPLHALTPLVTETLPGVLILLPGGLLHLAVFGRSRTPMHI